MEASVCLHLKYICTGSKCPAVKWDYTRADGVLDSAQISGILFSFLSCPGTSS